MTAAVAHDRIVELTELLLRDTRVTQEQIEEARIMVAESGGRLDRILVSLGHVTNDEVLNAFSQIFGLKIRPQIPADAVDDELAGKIPITFAKDHLILPINQDEAGAVRVAICNPLDTDPLDDLRLLFPGSEVRLELANQRTILGAINEVYDRGGGATDAFAEEAFDDLDSLADELSHEPQDLLEAAEDSPIIKLVNSMLQHAVKERTSDIHIEPFESEIRVRFRIDDVLYEPMKPLPRALMASIVSRIKIMGGLNIAEKRLPQDGRIRLKIAGRDYDVRLSTIPIAHGERVVMRLLPRTQDLLNLERIGFNEMQLTIMERLITRPNGIVLVTGPTGSGKTTTLYGALSRINATDKNIITIEDPVEIQLSGVGQIEVNPKIGLTFANGLRSILRQDPNVILVGEIRDLETAEIAIQASLTGHLVFSTLHTNDAASAITRLVDMGVEPFLVASSLVAVLAQRLVRVLCADCRVPYPATAEELVDIGAEKTHVGIDLYRAEGCAQCNYTGYRGRVGIFELMLVDDELRAHVSGNIDAKTIKQVTINKGMHTLRTDGARKVLDGITSVAEILRATEEEAVIEQI
ncbi:type II secretion system ATPase GspE [Myxococcota bacterium]|nr:type II secretion system ATPase GspE [Myxococcota bacterium]